MVDPLISVGIYLVHQSLTNEFWHVQVLLQLLDAEIVLGLALNQTGIDLAQIWNKNFFDEESILLRFRVDLLNFDFVKLLLLQQLLIQHPLIQGRPSLLPGGSFRPLSTQVLLLLIKLKCSPLFVHFNSKLFMIKLFHFIASIATEFSI